MPRANLNIEYTIQIWREADQFIAHAMPLDVMSSGQTPEDARQALDEAVRLFLLTAAEIGTLDLLMEETGYTYHDGTWEGPAWIGVERHTLSVVS